ncbi:hypothetical protein RHIZ404_230431 [Rhizobium sp. EC-SD404]|nr:hypothetical protein RHIZ404_230431 [Rhizobium sp. EC-SD404]
MGSYGDAHYRKPRQEGPLSAATQKAPTRRASFCSYPDRTVPSIWVAAASYELRIDAMLAELREQGVGIAFDDYGTGFASLNAEGLPRNPVEDRSILRQR